MKRIRSILSLCLVALMVLALLPAEARADKTCPNGKHKWTPWQSRPAATCTQGGTQYRSCTACQARETRKTPPLGHEWRLVSTEKATCIKEGVRNYVCSRCSATRANVIHLTDHTWDEGVVTQKPATFTPGEIVYTCTVCRKQKKEKLDPTGPLFDEIRHKPIEKPFTPISPLVITEQPSPGWVPYWHRDYWGTGHHMLHVAAEGGVEPYTYQWYYAPIPAKAISASEIKQAIRQQAEIISDTFHRVEGEIKPVLAGWKDGWLADAGITLRPAAEPGIARFYPDTKPVPKGTEPDYKVDQGGYVFWCVVTDAIRQTAVSNVVEVIQGFYFIEQPGDTTLDGGSATLHCRLGGGYGSYQYELIKLDPEADYYEENTEVITTYTGGAVADLPVTEPGEYTFYVTDLTTEEWGHSDFVWVRNPGEEAADAPGPEGTPSDESKPAETPAEAPNPEAPAEAPDGEKGDAQPEDTGRSLTGEWFAGIRGRIVKLTLNEDGTYAVAGLPQAEQKGLWALREGEVILDDDDEVSLWVREDGLLLIDANAMLRREAPELYVPADLVADAPPLESFDGYWKARYVAIGDAVLDADTLTEPVDLYVEGTNAALGGTLFGDVIVSLAYADGALTRVDEGVTLTLQLQQDGFLRLTIAAEETVVIYLLPEDTAR